jgi:hypothetical protein
VRVFLLHRDRDFAVRPELRDEMFSAMLSGDPLAVSRVRRDRERKRAAGPPPAPAGNDAVLARDLGLRTLWQAMADGDEFVYETAMRAVLSPLPDPDSISYRQRVLADCLARPGTVRELYQLAAGALETGRKAGGLWPAAGPGQVLHQSVRVLELQAGALRRLRQVAVRQAAGFRSEGFARFFAMVAGELPEDYLATIGQHLRSLEFRRGLLVSAGLGRGFRGSGYTVLAPRERGWAERLPLGNGPEGYSFTIAPRDESGLAALEEIREQAISPVAAAAAQAAAHVQGFFAMLRLELAFYLGCLNLHDRLTAKGEPWCFPEPLPAGHPAFTAEGIYDVCLSLRSDGRVVGNDVRADGRPLVMITGANGGGKSTLLRAMVLACLMTGAGMFAGARSFRAGISEGFFTHFRREDDAAAEGGRLDEELRRMSEIAGQIGPRSILACNESFASTSEREGSEIARQVVRAMLRRQIRVFFVTHMYDLARSLHDGQAGDALFLRAGRGPGGERTFRLAEGGPLPTSYGGDIWQRVFGDDGPGAPPAGGQDPAGG